MRVIADFGGFITDTWIIVSAPCVAFVAYLIVAKVKRWFPFNKQ